MTISQSKIVTTQNGAEIAIRVARRGDEDQVSNLIETVYQEFGFPWDADGYAADLYDLEAHYFDHGDLFWVAELGQEIVGTVALHLHEPIDGEGVLVQVEDLLRIVGSDCGLHRLYLKENFRGIGLGKKLTLVTFEEARSQGKKQMEIWSDKRLTTAHQLYQKLGAEIVGERLCNDPEQAPEWGLRLNL